MITKDIIEYGKVGKCAHVSNGIIEIAVMIDAGPRVIRYGFVGGQNVFCDDAPLELEVEGYDQPWKCYGGHRLLASPEKYPKTYYPDNDPCRYEWTDAGVKIFKPVHPNIQIEHIMELKLHEGDTKVEVLHTLVNKSEWTIHTSCWCTTMFQPGGFMALPFSTAPSHFVDGAKGIRRLVLWPYCDMDDPRIKWGNHYVLARHEAGNEQQTKFSIQNIEGWEAYFNHDELFINRFAYDPDAEYPEGGGNSVCYMCDFMHEMESLSPMVDVLPGKSISHLETWELHKDVAAPESFDEANVKAIMEKYL